MNYLTLISHELQTKSASSKEIALPFEDVIKAIAELRDKNIAIPAWELWLVFPGMIKMHPPEIRGMIPYKNGPGETWNEFVC